MEHAGFNCDQLAICFATWAGSLRRNCLEFEFAIDVLQRKTFTFIVPL
jgi:hypothetical protein